MSRSRKTVSPSQCRILFVYSLDRRRVNRVMAQARQEYLNTSDILSTLIVAAKACVMANLNIREGVPLPISYDCDPEMAKQAIHECTGCGDDVICRDQQVGYFKESLDSECKRSGRAYGSEKVKRLLQSFKDMAKEKLGRNSGLAPMKWLDEYRGVEETLRITPPTPSRPLANEHQHRRCLSLRRVRRRVLPSHTYELLSDRVGD